MIQVMRPSSVPKLRAKWNPARTANTRAQAAAILLCLAILPSCTPRARNLQLDRQSHDETKRYRFDALEPGNEDQDDTFVFVSFSGGGTRAAALAYGVLQGMNAVTIGNGTLLDELDMISSVSGGSFTAMAYGLWGKVMFKGRFEKRFLRRNVMLDLILQALNPLNLLSLPMPVLDSIDIAATYYDRRIFCGSSYADLIERNRRPFVVINATDVARKQTFEFTQDEFDLLGSDLATLPVAWAVAASSAFPVLFSPMRLHYYPGEAMKDAVHRALDAPRDTLESRRGKWAESLLVGGRRTSDPARLDADRHKYLYLMDGGVSDNLGLHAFIRAFRTGCIRERIDNGRIKRLVVIIVDAATEKPTDYEQSVIAPGWLTSLLTTLDSGVQNNSRLTSAVVHYLLEEADQNSSGHHPQFESFVVDVNLRTAATPSLLKQFASMVTSFVLPQNEITSLIEHGKQQILMNKDIVRLSSMQPKKDVDEAHESARR